MHGTPAAWARLATPSAVLPKAVWASIRPSPVMTRSARASLRRSRSPPSPGRRRAAARTTGTGPGSPAGRTRRRRRRRRPACRARAGPSRASSSSAQRAFRASSSRDLRRAWRPSAGRRWRPRRSGPRSGFDDVAGDRRGRRSGRDRAAGRDRRRAERRRAGRAPPSVVALPPIPSMMRRDAGVDRGADQLAGPDVVAADGSRSSGRDAATGRTPRPSRRPRASPSSDRSQRAVDRAAQRVVDRRPSATSQPPAAAIASSVPSPPSASGRQERSVVGAGAAPAVGQRPGDLDRRQRALERVGREEDRQRRRSPAGPSRSRSCGDGSPSASSAWFGTTPNSLPAERAVQRVGGAAGHGVEDQQPATLGPGAASAAAMSAAPMPRRRASRWTRTLPISARCGEFGLRRADEQRRPDDPPVAVARDEQRDRASRRRLRSARPPGRGLAQRSRRRGS